MARLASRIPWAYVARRLLAATPTMLAIITFAFFMVRVAPGNPWSAERKLPPQIEANLKASMGLDRPLHEQYFESLGKVVTGDFGPSLRNKDKTVAELIGDGLRDALDPKDR